MVVDRLFLWTQLERWYISEVLLQEIFWLDRRFLLNELEDILQFDKLIVLNRLQLTSLSLSKRPQFISIKLFISPLGAHILTHTLNRGERTCTLFSRKGECKFLRLDSCDSGEGTLLSNLGWR